MHCSPTLLSGDLRSSLRVLRGSCLPVADHQIFTSHGYWFHQQVMDYFGDDPFKSLLVACDVQGECVFLPIRSSDVVHEFAYSGDLIDFQCTLGNSVESIFNLTVTSNHTMWACKGRVSDHGNYDWTDSVYHTIPAQSVHAYLHQSCHHVVRFQTCFYASIPHAFGLVPLISNDAFNQISQNYEWMSHQQIVGILDIAEPIPLQLHHLLLPPVRALGLKSLQQLIAFMCLYGYWVGDGSAVFRKSAHFTLVFAPVKPHDVPWLEKCLRVAGLFHNVCYSLFDHGQRHKSKLFRITRRAWCEFFHRFYAAKYKSWDQVQIDRLLSQSTCEICRQGESNEDDLILFCDAAADETKQCNKAYHQQCLIAHSLSGEIPEGDFIGPCCSLVNEDKSKGQSNE